MKNNLLTPLFKLVISLFNLVLYICFFGLCVIATYKIFTHNPLLFKRLLKLWPIGLLIISAFLQYFFLEFNFSGFLFLAGFFFVIGIIFNINLHESFYNSSMKLPILFIASAASLLNYYLFKNNSIFLLPLILFLILIGLLLLLIPLYFQYLIFTIPHIYL